VDTVNGYDDRLLREALREAAAAHDSSDGFMFDPVTAREAILSNELMPLPVSASENMTREQVAVCRVLMTDGRWWLWKVDD
jgi:hypothetical protein